MYDTVSVADGRFRALGAAAPRGLSVCVRTRDLPIQPRRGGLNLAQDVSPGLSKERCLVPEGRLNPLPAVSTVSAGLVELLDVFPGLRPGQVRLKSCPDTKPNVASVGKGRKFRISMIYPSPKM